jgi:murein tripeptide amidase MpaA
LNVTEVESALSVATSAPYTGFTQLITLPNLTFEGRQCHAIKVANGSGPGRPGVYFLGGVHAREWGSSDILINFVEQLEQAYQSGTGLTLGGKTYSPSDIQTIVNSLDIFVFPQANPDGRNYSMNTDANWRKNRRTAAPNSAACPGVDVNRNYDFLWDFPKYFSSASAISDSTDPCDGGYPNNDNGTYHGPSAFSEPESSNAKWVFDTFPNIGYFVDLHSYGKDILYSWGDDEDQSSDPTMNFRNPAFDGKRGVAGDAYKEFIPSDDLSTALDLANTFNAGIQAARGTNYTVKPSFNLYPTAGTSDDYAYSRHFVDPGKQNVISYTLEWGTEFQPPYSEMQNIIQEITSGLLAFCLWVRNSLKRCSFLIERSTLGQDEISARRKQLPKSAGGLPVQDAFRVVVDGFTAKDLGLTASSSTLSVPPVFNPSVNGMTIIPSTIAPNVPNVSDNGDYGSEIQRFTFFYDIDFPDLTDPEFNFTTPTELVNLNVTVDGVSAAGQIELIKQPNPFILHGDPAWLSIDLRVFVVRAREPKFGATMGADASAAPGFIQQVIANLTSGNGTADGDSFGNLPTDESAKLFVYPTDNTGTNVFNFAVAKVHYIGLIGAADVRVFFRLFQAQTTSGAFDYPPGLQYRRAPSNPHGQPIPLAGIQGNEYITIPCFAAGRIDSSVLGMDQQTDDPYNVQTFTAHLDGSEVDRYFGCWLDINQPFKPNGDPNNVLPAQVDVAHPDGPFTDPLYPPVPIQSAILKSLHQCLIAEISFDKVVIPIGVDPSNWDKLAQRNLAWSDIGSAQALSTFEIRPTPTGLPADQTPDELMIDWRHLPKGSSAQIYLPAVSAADVLAMANKMYTSHRLTRADEHTIKCTTGGITYVPIPAGGNTNYAGLLSVELADPVRLGQIFDVVIQQVTNAFGKVSPPPPPPSQIAARPDSGAVVTPAQIEWRRVLGAFQLSIPVKTKAALLFTEERELSVLRWIARAIPHSNRWFPVFRRYLEQVAGRVIAFGGDPTQILPSPTGEGRGPHRRPEEPEGEKRRAFTGKIAGLIFDRFGDFEGFVLDTEDGDRKFFSREKAMEELAERAWVERLRITVWAERDEPHRPLSTIVREPPAPFRR